MQKRTIKKIATILLLVALVSGAVFACNNASNVLAKICSSEVNARINDIINRSNDVVMALDVFYKDYFTVMSDEDGQITAIIANTGLINQMTLIWNTEIQNRLNEMRLLKLSMPAGVMTGSSILSQFGAEIDVNAHVVSNCAITYKSKLVHSGINQTLHQLVLYTEIKADVSVPLRAKNVVVSQEVVLVETLLPGAVPDSYLIGDDSCDYLDLLP